MTTLTVSDCTQTGQFVPADSDGARWNADQDRFLALLQDQGLDVELHASAFNPYPFLVSRERLVELEALQASIYRAIIAVVTHFGKDARISQVIQLPAAEQDLLRLIADMPYRPGSIRPDFLHAADGREMITEINARFTLNGFFSSMKLNRAVPRLHPELDSLPGLENLELALRARLGDGRIGILKDSEPGWEIHMLRARWGDRCEMLAPKELTAGHLSRWQSVVLELHQHELVGGIPAELLGKLAGHPGALNDLRTILIAHDKRLLSILSTDRVLDDYLEADDVARLRRHVIPTWVKGEAPEKVREALAHPAGWLAKPPRSGKGKGIVVSSLLDPAQWRHTLRELPDDWVLQPYIEQQSFPISVVRDGDLVSVPMLVVGCLPALDENGFGPGVYRAAEGAVVNVAGGGIILAPALMGGDSCPV